VPPAGLGKGMSALNRAREGDGQVRFPTHTVIDVI